MASGRKRLLMGLTVATVFVLAIGGLAAFGAGLFDNVQDAPANSSASQVAPEGNACPFTGCSDKKGAASQAGTADACSEDGACPPSKMKTGTAATSGVATGDRSDAGGCSPSMMQGASAPADAAGQCSGGAGGCGEKKPCSDDGSCGGGGCSADN